MARRERPPGPVRARVLRLRRAFGRTQPGQALKRLLRREARIPVAAEPNSALLIAFPGEDDLPEELQDRRIFDDAVAQARVIVAQPAERRRHRERAARRVQGRPIVNVVLVSHCDFDGNSALHVYAIASELHRRGLSPIMAVPDHAEGVADVGRPAFPVLTYAETHSSALRFPDGRGPDLVHAWTPRELVRMLTVALVRARGCRYVVHLEDSEEAVLSAEHGGVSVAALKQLPAPMLDRIVRPRQAHPLRAARFLEQAAGVTVLIDRLLELVPAGVPAAVAPAGFDEAVLSPRRSRDEVRAELRVAPSELVIVYPGNIHMVNMEEMRSLWAAVAQLRSAGHPVVLVKTGWGSTQTVTFPPLGAGLRDLGWVRRETVPELLAAADILVQPGGPGPFNDFRFPSKLPEFLASGRPVVLPRTNLGLKLRDGEEALLLERGDAPEIAAAVARLAADPALRVRLGEAGRAFALRELRWTTSVDRVQELYSDIATSGRLPVPAWALDGADPPVKLVALVSDVPSAADAELARSHGVYGFCFDPRMSLGPEREFRFCFRVRNGDPAAIVLASLWDPCYLRVGGVPLLLAYDANTAAKWREQEGLDVQLAIAPTARNGESLTRERILFADDTSYTVWLRKLVLQALLGAKLHDPLVLVDAARVWPQQERKVTWLAATRTGLRDGIRQYYASRRVPISLEETDRILGTS
jgi:glycosyltransferase involved in cell wall biosynthesis